MASTPAVPLGLGCVASEDAVRAVLDDLNSQGVHRHFGTRIDGRRLQADDLAWTYLSGETATGPAHQLILALTGTLPASDLHKQHANTLKHELTRRESDC
jgi:hypothetical protein